MNKDGILKRLQNWQGKDLHIRGDDDLNPGMAPPQTLVPAAVLVGLVDRDDGFHVLLTERAEHLPQHPGQISFPGGRIEDFDVSEEDAALRETKEETGLSGRHIETIGRLDAYRTRTGFRITPVVGLISPPFEIKPDTREVASVFEVPLAFFLNPENHQRLRRPFDGVMREYYAMPYDDYYIWGATAGMLVNLYEILAAPDAATRKAI